MTKQAKKGRPSIDNSAALEAVLSKPETREVFIGQLDKLVHSKEGLKVKTDLYKDDVASVAEAYGLSKGFVGKLVMDVMKGGLDEKIAELTNHVDVLQVLMEST